VSDFDSIDQLAAAYEWQRRSLYELIEQLERKMTEVKAVALPSIRQQVGETAAARDALHNAIDEARTLFEKPRTRTFHGIKVGLQKAKGQVEIDDEERTIKRIRETLIKDQAELLIRVRETVDKNAVRDIEPTDLKSFGIRIGKDRDTVVVKPQDSEVGKLVDALLARDEEELDL
jgi:uncharacterized membrane protein YccC